MVKEVMALVECFIHYFEQLHPISKQPLRKWEKRLLNTGLDTGMKIAQDVINGQPVERAAKSRAKAAGINFQAGAIQDITQRGNGKKVLKRKRKAIPVSSRQTKKRRTSTAKFHTIMNLFKVEPTL